MKKAKKFLGAALTVVMVVSSLWMGDVKTTDAATASSVTIGNYLSGNSGAEEQTGDFDVTYTFTNTSTGSESYHNFTIELYDANNEWVRVRADNWLTTVANGTEETAVALGDYAGVNWNTWIPAMQAGAECTVNVKRSGEKVTVTMETAESITFTGVVNAPDLADTVFVQLTGEQVKLDDIVFTENVFSSDIVLTGFNITGADTRYKTGDFDITYTFHHVSNGSANHEIYGIELRGDDNSCIDVLGNRHGWTWSEGTGSVNLTDEVKEDFLPWADGCTWDNFAATIQSGMDVTVNIARTGDVFVITTDNTFCKFKYTIPYDMTDRVKVGLGGENCTLSNFEVIDNTAEDIKLNMDNYINGGDKIAPVQTDKVFAGWYTDSTCTTPVEDNATGYAYAKFVDDGMLDTKYQLSAGVTESSPSTDIRLMLGVDSLNYSEVGFKITYDGVELNKYSSTKVYTGINVTTGSGTTVDEPSTYFGADAEYMLPFVLKNIQNASFSKEIVVTPYWVTLDGTVVEGDSRTFSVDDSFN